MILGGAFYGVVSCQILIGYLSDKYGKCKLQMLMGVSIIGSACVLSPTVILHLGDYYFFALRVLMGMGTVIGSSLNHI